MLRAKFQYLSPSLKTAEAAELSCVKPRAASFVFTNSFEVYSETRESDRNNYIFI